MLSTTRLLATVCTIALSPTVSAKAATKTGIILFSPWSPSGVRQGFVVSGKVKGSCWTHSLASDRSDAWRCMAGNDIYDPCFSGSPHEGTVACAEGPFSKNVVLMTLTKALADNVMLTGELGGLRLKRRPLAASPGQRRYVCVRPGSHGRRRGRATELRVRSNRLDPWASGSFRGHLESAQRGLAA